MFSKNVLWEMIYLYILIGRVGPFFKAYRQTSFFKKDEFGFLNRVFSNKIDYREKTDILITFYIEIKIKYWKSI